jgi:enamine deaminase RidA (YjgF/YER057c/UK114 family)
MTLAGVKRGVNRDLLACAKPEPGQRLSLPASALQHTPRRETMTTREAIFPPGRHALYEKHGHSAALRSGDLLFVAGQVGSHGDGNPTAVGVTWLAGFDFEIKVIARIPDRD